MSKKQKVTTATPVSPDPTKKVIREIVYFYDDHRATGPKALHEEVYGLDEEAGDTIVLDGPTGDTITIVNSGKNENVVSDCRAFIPKNAYRQRTDRYVLVKKKATELK